MNVDKQDGATLELISAAAYLARESAWFLLKTAGDHLTIENAEGLATFTDDIRDLLARIERGAPCPCGTEHPHSL